MRIRPGVAGAGLLVVSCLVLAACSSSSTTSASGPPTPSGSQAATASGESTTASATPLRVGVEAPLTGSQSVTGTGMVNGAQLAADTINAAGGIDGRAVEIVPIDDAADPATGVTAATAAVAAGLDAVIGPYNSSVGVKTLPIYEQAGLVPLRLTSNSATNGMGYTLQPMDYQIAPVAAAGLTTWLHAARVAIIYDASQNYTTDLATDLRTALRDQGVAVPVFEPITPGRSSYAKQIASAAAAKPDVIYLAAYFPEGGLMAKQMRAAGVAARCVADYASYDPGFVTTAGTAAARACAVVGVPAASDFPGGPAFTADYTAAFSSAPGSWSPYTYDSLRLLADAATASGGFAAAGLASYLDGVTDWQGVTGSVTIDAATGNRDPATVVFTDVNEAGEFHVDKDWATAVGADY